MIEDQYDTLLHEKYRLLGIYNDNASDDFISVDLSNAIVDITHAMHVLELEYDSNGKIVTKDFR